MPDRNNFFIKPSIIKESRSQKELAKEQGVGLRGQRGKYIEEIEQKIKTEVQDLLDENREWINEKKEKVLEVISGRDVSDETKKKEVMLDFDDREVFRAFDEGLIIFFKQEYRLMTKDQKREHKATPDNLQNPEYIRKKILAYTFDFIQSLKASQRVGIMPLQALELAKLSYWHNPGLIKKLFEKYPNVDRKVIIAIARRNPSKTEDYIDEYLLRVKEFKIKYPDIDEEVINYIAFHRHIKPDKFIADYLANNLTVNL